MPQSVHDDILLFRRDERSAIMGTSPARPEFLPAKRHRDYLMDRWRGRLEPGTGRFSGNGGSWRISLRVIHNGWTAGHSPTVPGIFCHATPVTCDFCFHPYDNQYGGVPTPFLSVTDCRMQATRPPVKRDGRILMIATSHPPIAGRSPRDQHRISRSQLGIRFPGFEDFQPQGFIVHHAPGRSTRSGHRARRPLVSCS